VHSLLSAPFYAGLVLVVMLSALVPAAAAAGYVSSARRLESPIVPQCLANIDFAQRVSADRSGFSVPPIAIRDPRYLLVPAVRCGDETIFRDLKFTLAKNASFDWLERDRAANHDGAYASEACLQGSAHEG
jgi:hypothetical protein